MLHEAKDRNWQFSTPPSEEPFIMNPTHYKDMNEF